MTRTHETAAAGVRLVRNLPGSLPRILGWLGALLLGLGAMDMLTNVWLDVETGAIRRMWNLAREDSVGTWVSQLLLLATGLAWLVLSRSFTGPGERGVRWRVLLLGALFLYMSADDGAQIHERIGSFAKTFLSEETAASLPSYLWQVVYAPLFGGMALLLVWIALADARPLVFGLCLLGVVASFVTAVGLDYFEGMLERALEGTELAGRFEEHAASHGLRVIEELLEMFGAALALAVALSWAARRRVELVLRAGRP